VAADGTYFDPGRGKVTLAEFVVSDVLSSSHLSEKTRSNYEGVWRRHVRPRLGERRLNSIALRPPD
jgi:hypothetical protein